MTEVWIGLSALGRSSPSLPSRPMKTTNRFASSQMSGPCGRGISVRPYHPDLEKMTEAFTEVLLSMGYPPSPGGIMLSRSLWRKSVSAFGDTLRQWIHGDDLNGPMNLAIFLDAARARLERLLMDDTGSTPASSPRPSSSRAVAGGRGCPVSAAARRRRSTRRRVGLFPIVYGIRALALQYRVKETPTVARLEALEAGGASMRRLPATSSMR